MAVNFVTFNQDHSILAVATSQGFKQFNTEPFSLSCESKQGDVSLLEMLFSTSLIALILSPRLLRIINTKVRLAWVSCKIKLNANSETRRYANSHFLRKCLG